MAKVNTQHPEYKKMISQWQKCRDTSAGQKAVHDAAEKYLPRLKDQDADDYKAYLTRTLFFNAVWRTIDALKGLMFRKPPTEELPKSMEPLFNDVTLSGVSLRVFAQQSVVEILTSGRMGILVDYPQVSTEGLTLAEAQAINARPTMQMYPAESIINWKENFIVLKEKTQIPSGEFEHESEDRYRVIDLVNGVYRQRVFRINDQDDDEQVGGDIYPVMNGWTLDYIPFYFIGIDNTSSGIDEPPLIDLVDVNLAHYRLDADHKHGLHFTGLPTPVISGYTPEDGDKLYVGSSSAWCFPDPQAKASFLEFTGQGLNAIAEEKVRAEQQMAILGARLLTAEKKDAETAQTAQIHRAGEQSILASIAQTISTGLTMALNTFCEWAGNKGKWSIELNREFMPIGMTPQELTALLAGWQMGAPGLSDEGLFNIFKQREMIQDGVTLEDEQARISSKPIPKADMAE